VALFDFAGATEQTLAAYQPRRHRSLYGFAEDLVLLMKSMRIRGATYVGHSLGGVIGMLACNGDPGLFDSLVLLGASARYVDDPAAGYVGGFTEESIDQLVASMQNDYVAWANGFAPLAMGNPDRPVLAQEFTRSLLRLRPDIAAAVLGAAFHSDHRKDVQRLKVPVQVLQTESDVAVPLAAAEWLAAHSRARDFAIVAAQGHFPQLSAPEAVNAAILKFLAAHAGA
jgi:sigma-B regulation protein RsbQ